MIFLDSMKLPFFSFKTLTSVISKKRETRKRQTRLEGTFYDTIQQKSNSEKKKLQKFFKSPFST
jgi:hypothetical protein